MNASFAVNLYGEKPGPWSKQAKHFRFVPLPKHTYAGACPQARSDLLYSHSITLAAAPAPLSHRHRSYTAVNTSDRYGSNNAEAI